jgi:hypothetical protein
MDIKNPIVIFMMIGTESSTISFMIRIDYYVNQPLDFFASTLMLFTSEEWLEII